MGTSEKDKRNRKDTGKASDRLQYDSDQDSDRSPKRKKSSRSIDKSSSRREKDRKKDRRRSKDRSLSPERGRGSDRRRRPSSSSPSRANKKKGRNDADLNADRIGRVERVPHNRFNAPQDSFQPGNQGSGSGPRGGVRERLEREERPSRYDRWNADGDWENNRGPRPERGEREGSIRDAHPKGPRLGSPRETRRSPTPPLLDGEGRGPPPNRGFHSRNWEGRGGDGPAGGRGDRYPDSPDGPGRGPNGGRHNWGGRGAPYGDDRGRGRGRWSAQGGRYGPRYPPYQQGGPPFDRGGFNRGGGWENEGNWQGPPHGAAGGRGSDWGEWGPERDFPRDKGPPSGSWQEGGRGRGRNQEGRGHPPHPESHRNMPPGNRMRGPPPFPPRLPPEGTGRGGYSGFTSRRSEKDSREKMRERVERISIRRVCSQLESIQVSPTLAGSALYAEYETKLECSTKSIQGTRLNLFHTQEDADFQLQKLPAELFERCREMYKKGECSSPVAPDKNLESGQVFAAGGVEQRSRVGSFSLAGSLSPTLLGSLPAPSTTLLAKLQRVQANFTRETIASQAIKDAAAQPDDKGEADVPEKDHEDSEKAAGHPSGVIDDQSRLSTFDEDENQLDDEILAEDDDEDDQYRSTFDNGRFDGDDYPSRNAEGTRAEEEQKEPVYDGPAEVVWRRADYKAEIDKPSERRVTRSPDRTPSLERTPSLKSEEEDEDEGDVEIDSRNRSLEDTDGDRYEGHEDDLEMEHVFEEETLDS